MRRPMLAIVFLLGVAGGITLQRSLPALLSTGIGLADDRDAVPKGPSGTRPKKDKRLVAVDPDIAKVLGIEIAVAGPGVLANEIPATGTIGFNEDKLARVVPRVSGTVRTVLKGIGDRVEAGETLVILDSKEVADAKSAYIAADDKLALAETTFARQDELFRKRISSEQDFIPVRRELAQARSDIRVATQALLTLGFRDDDLTRLAGAPVDLSRYAVTSPLAGEIVEKRIYVGEHLPQDREIFVVADLSVVLAHLQIGVDKLGGVAPGQAVRILADEGRLTAKSTLRYLAPVVAEETRAAAARVDIANPDRRWRPGTVVEARIEGPAAEAAVIVPADAVQTVDGQTSVFLPVPGGFHRQNVKLGRSNGSAFEVLKGLKPGDRIATGQTFVLKAELEKAAFGEDDD